MDATLSIYDVASEAYDCFEVARRGDDPEQPFVRIKDGSPEWVTQLAYAAHGDFLPDDWRYQSIRSCLGDIADNEPEDLDDYISEWADSNVDVYNGARCAWLASDLRRGGYCDEAAAEFGFTVDDSHGVFDLIGLGQYAESEEVFAAVAQALRERLDEVSAGVES